MYLDKQAWANCVDQDQILGTFSAKKYRIWPNYHTVRLDFSKLLNKLVVKYQPNKGTL